MKRSRSRRGPIPKRKCLECGKLFRPSKRSHRYHNSTCKNRASQRRRRRALKSIKKLAQSLVTPKLQSQGVI